MDEPVLHLENVTKFYGKRLALDDVTLQVSPGVTGLLGPNGCGKSTMIKCLLGLLKFQQGRARVMGHELPQGVRSIRDAVGYVPEDDCFLAGLSGIESTCFMARLSGLPAIEGLRRAHESMDYADIGQERYRNVETYSTGMRQKLKFAQAIVHDPALLILDEPTSGLDPAQRVSLLKKIKTLATHHNKSVLICTHILHDVSQICDNVVIMAAGRIKLVDSLENLSRPSRSGVQVRLEQNTASADSLDSCLQTFMAAMTRAGHEFDRQSHDAFLIHNVQPHQADSIWRAAADAGVTIFQLKPAKNSLEEVFLSAVRETEHAVA
ncbi:MAG: ABC transporter ATP-binding protein [Planctomycetales bacterium]|nr:ABC transporter ATP-binding protein [Planctomycetales bacterium]